MLSRAGILAMALVDVVMLGRYGTQALAEASVALGLFIPIMVTGVGLQMGVISLVSRRFGAGRTEECVEIWLRSLTWATVAGLAGAGLMALGVVWLRLIGQSEALVAGGGAVSLALAPGVLFQVLYITCAFYLEGSGRPKAAMLAMLGANLLNVALNWVFIYGNLGAPELGAVGSAISTTAVRVFLFLVVFVVILRLPEVRAAGGLSRIGGFWGPGGWKAGAEMRRIGFAAGLSVGFETTAFGALTQMAGLIGPTALAAYSIAHNIEATVFMVALGLSVAAAVRVGSEAGAGRPFEARYAGWLGLGACFAVMGAIGLGLLAAPEALAAVYSADPAVKAATVGLIAVVALTVLPDGGQIVMGQCNRALGDSYVASALYFVAFWVVMVPLAAVFVFVLDAGVVGLMWATFLGASLSLLLQGGRFAVLSRRLA
jgi:MATE family multidrug resistance protein